METAPITEVRATLSLPPSVNRMYADIVYWDKRQGRYRAKRVATQALRDYQQTVMMELLVEHRPALYPDFPLWQRATSVGYSMRIYTRTRASDLSNRIKAVEDALATFFHFNDNCVDDMHITKHIDRERPRIELSLYITALLPVAAPRPRQRRSTAC